MVFLNSSRYYMGSWGLMQHELRSRCAPAAKWPAAATLFFFVLFSWVLADPMGLVLLHHTHKHYCWARNALRDQGSSSSIVWFAWRGHFLVVSGVSLAGTPVCFAPNHGVYTPGATSIYSYTSGFSQLLGLFLTIPSLLIPALSRDQGTQLWICSGSAFSDCVTIWIPLTSKLAISSGHSHHVIGILCKRHRISPGGNIPLSIYYLMELTL